MSLFLILLVSCSGGSSGESGSSGGGVLQEMAGVLQGFSQGGESQNPEPEIIHDFPNLNPPSEEADPQDNLWFEREISEFSEVFSAQENPLPKQLFLPGGEDVSLTDGLIDTFITSMGTSELPVSFQFQAAPQGFIGIEGSYLQVGIVDLNSLSFSKNPVQETEEIEKVAFVDVHIDETSSNLALKNLPLNSVCILHSVLVEETPELSLEGDGSVEPSSSPEKSPHWIRLNLPEPIAETCEGEKLGESYSYPCDCYYFQVQTESQATLSLLADSEYSDEVFYYNSNGGAALYGRGGSDTGGTPQDSGSTSGGGEGGSDPLTPPPPQGLNAQGADQFVNDYNRDGSETVNLDANQSTGTIVQYEWRKADGSLIASSNESTTSAVFTAGIHQITLIVYDPELVTDTDTVTIHVNRPANASAGADQFLANTDGDNEEQVTLEGSGSGDPDGDAIHYYWLENYTSLGSGQNPTVTLSAGIHPITLYVCDPWNACGIDYVVITINRAPVAEAGNPQTLTPSVWSQTSMEVTLDGSGSSDSDGSLVSYRWSKADGTDLAPASASPTLTKNLPVGTHEIKLTVTDNHGSTHSDTVSITINETPANQPPVAIFNGPNGLIKRSNDANPTVEFTVTPLPGASGVPGTILNGLGSYDPDDQNGDGNPDGVWIGEWMSQTGTTTNYFTYNAPFTYPYLLPAGQTHVLTFRVYEQSGLSSGVVTATIHVNEAPNVLPTASLSIAGGVDWVTDGDDSGSESMSFDASNSSDVDGEIVGAIWYVDGQMQYSVSGTLESHPNVLTPSIDLQTGNHTVAVAVFDDDNGISVPVEVSVFVNKPPIANTEDTNPVSYTDMDGDGAVPVQLSGSASTDVDGQIIYYGWKRVDTGEVFSDSAETIMVDLAPRDAPYEFELIVKDDRNAANVNNSTNHIAITVAPQPANSPPVADAGPDQMMTDTEGFGSLMVFLDGTNSSDAQGPIKSYRWLRNGEEILNSASGEVELSVGIHTLMLEVTDINFATGTDTVQITINQAPPIAIFTDPEGNQTVSSPDEEPTVIFSVTSEPGANTALVPLDGTHSYDPNGSITFYEWMTPIGGRLSAFQTVALATGQTHNITFRVFDDSNYTPSPYINLVVNIADSFPKAKIETLPPFVNDSDRSGNEVVAFDGSESSDDGEDLQYRWFVDGVFNKNYLGATPNIDLDLGQHTVSLKVIDDLGQESEEVSVDIFINDPPVADASGTVNPVTDMDGSGSEMAQLNASQSTDDEGIVLCQWTDQTTGDVVVPPVASHFSDVDFEVGTHVLLLTVTDSRGATSTDEFTLTILEQPANLPPIADAGPDQVLTDVNGGGGLFVDLDASNSYDPDGSIVSYHWFWMTGQVENQRTTTSPFLSVILPVGSHTLTLTVTDEYSNVGTDTVQINILQAPPVAVFTDPFGNHTYSSPNEVRTVTFSVTPQPGANTAGVPLDGRLSFDPNGAITFYEWMTPIGGRLGAFQTVALVTGQTHNITFRVFDDSNYTPSPYINLVVHIPDAFPKAIIETPPAFVTDSDRSGSEVVTFNAGASSDDGGVLQYRWSVDGVWHKDYLGATPNIDLGLGQHTVSLKVIDDHGQASEEVSVAIYVNDPPVADASGTVNPLTDMNGSGAETAQLNASQSTDDEGIVLCQWTDKATGEEIVPPVASHFSDVDFAVGTHVLILTVTDTRGATSTDEFTLTILEQPANSPPVADAGPDQVMTDVYGGGGLFVDLNASNSYDPDGSIVSYHWSWMTGQVENQRTTTSPFLSIILPVGSHALTLTVTDEYSHVGTDTVNVTIYQAPPVAGIVGPDGFDVFSDPNDNHKEVYFTFTPAPGTDKHPVYFDGTPSFDPNGFITFGEWMSPNYGPCNSLSLNYFCNLATGTTHVITFRVLDNSNYTSSPYIDLIVTIENAPPSAQIAALGLVPDSDANGSETVVLDGTGSFDDDGIAHYRWSVDGVSLTAAEYDTATPSITFGAGYHTLLLVVVDEEGLESAPASGFVVINRAPNANPNKTLSQITPEPLSQEVLVTLDGSFSSDPDEAYGDSVQNWVWKNVATGQKYFGEVIHDLSLPAGDEPIQYTFSLVVSDESNRTSQAAQIIITVDPIPNVAPFAIAGNDQTLNPGSGQYSIAVNLNGAASYDPDGQIVSYQWDWSLWGTPESTSGSNPTITLPVGVHTLTLTVTDDDGAVGFDTVTITVDPPQNQPPVANAGANQTVTASSTTGKASVTLYGSASDPDGTVQSHLWSPATKVNSPNSLQTTTIELGSGTHSFTLTVTDNDGASSSDSVTITVQSYIPPGDGGCLVGRTMAEDSLSPCQQAAL